MSAWNDVGRLALIIEDEVLIALATEEILHEEGFNTHVMYSEEEVEKFQNLSASIAIVDLQIGSNIAGKNIIKQLRLKNPNLPIVVVTGHTKNNLEADLRGLGGPTARLIKPACHKDFVSSVRDVMERYQHGILSHTGRRCSDKQKPTTLKTMP